MNNASLVKPVSRGGKFRSFVTVHKFVSGVIAIIVVGGGWYWYAAATKVTPPTKYVVENATAGTVIATISGTGQMQAGTTVAVKGQTSENVVSIPVTVGERVAAGQLLVQLDTTNEARALAQAKLSLQSAELSLAKINEAPATTTLIQDQNSITQDQSNLVNASATLQRDYQTGFDTLGSSFVDFQNVMLGLQNFVQGNDISKAQNDPDAYINLLPNYLQASALTYRNDVQSTYAAASLAYQQNLLDYHASNRNASPASLDSLFSETYTTAQSISNAVKSVKDLLNYVVDNYPTQNAVSLPAITTTLQTNTSNYTTTSDNDVSNIGSAVNTIASDKTSIANDQLAMNQASSSLAALLAGADPLDIQSSQLSLQQQQLSLQTAEQNLADDSIRAPISGIVASIPAVIGEGVPSPAVNLVGDGQIAEVTLNEVDAAKVNLGDKATLTFDALPNLSLAGQVVELDPVGTVSQGVVSYNAQISLATSNDQVKPGMSVSVNIVTQADQNVIALPNAAIVTVGGMSFVSEPATPLSPADLASSSSGGIVLPAAPVRVPVTIGISNGTMTEITSGVNAGDQVIVQTIAGTTATTAPTAAAGGTNALRALGGAGGAGGFGGGGGGGGFVRTGGGG